MTPKVTIHNHVGARDNAMDYISRARNIADQVSDLMGQLEDAIFDGLGPTSEARTVLKNCKDIVRRAVG